MLLVPTRALITEASRELNYLLSNNDISAEAKAIPGDVPAAGQNAVYVFTQERLHWHIQCLADQEEFSLIIADEAHKVGDQNRGVLLQLVLEQLASTYPTAKFVFASPLTDNPSELLRTAPAGVNKNTLKGNLNTVNQNLIWATQIYGSSTEWQLLNVGEHNARTIGNFTLTNRPSGERKRLSYVAYALAGPSSGNVIYVNGAAEAEIIAWQIYDQLGTECNISDERIFELQRTIQRSVHNKFLLYRVLGRGVAFHYGNMPQIVRSEIERLFAAGLIRYLICTSTLVEGVNLACRNIFLRGPRRGQGTPMTPADFWNLAGRAGRWGKEFQGNIICVDPYKENLWYQGEPPRKRMKFLIQRTTERTLNQPNILIEFIDRGGISKKQTERYLEYVYSYLTILAVQYGDLSLSPAANIIPKDFFETLNEKILEKLDISLVSRETILRNPGISSVGMDALYTYFEERIEKKHPENFLPPDIWSDEPVSSYTAIFSRLFKNVGALRLGSDRRAFGVALLTVKWMRGVPLPQLINDRYAYEQKRNPSINIASVIRRVMEDVETTVRFEVPKYLSAYADVLSNFYHDKGMNTLAGRIQDYSLSLEFGVSEKTQISLMSLGLSRTTAIAISEYITDSDLDKEDVINVLRSFDLEGIDIPALCVEEIRRVLELS